MIANTHVYLLKQQLGKTPPDLAVIGSVLPDIAITGIIGWDSLHKKDAIEELSGLAKKLHPELIDLGIGLESHYLVDGVTHKNYKGGIGYAFQKITPELVEMTAQAFKIDDENAAKTIAHNVIELAVDSYVMESNPEVLTLIESSVRTVDKNAIAELLSSFFNTEINKTKSAVDNYLDHMIEYNTRDINECVDLCDDVNQAIFNKSVDRAKTEQAVIYAKDLVKDSYQEFLAAAS